MSKDTFYFTHDYNSRNDSKIKKLLHKHGYAGYGLFWALIEELYNNANALPLDYESIAFDLRTDKIIIESIINDFDLFVFDGNSFGSLSVQKRLEKRSEKSVKARESAFKRWNKDANALQTDSERKDILCEGNAIKERKGKENKVKENNIDERKLKFASTLEPFLSKYGKDMLNDFYKYWTEPNKSGTKFRQELEKTWSLDRRLETWANNDKGFKKSSNEPTKKRKQFNLEV